MSNRSGDTTREMLERHFALRAGAIEPGAVNANDRSSLLLSALLRGSSVQNLLGRPNAALAGSASVEGEVTSTAALKSRILLANALAQERQNKLAAARRSLVTDSYRRGREEAISSLIQSGALRKSSLPRQAVSPATGFEPVVPLRPAVESPTVVALDASTKAKKKRRLGFSHLCPKTSRPPKSSRQGRKG